jgi:hypothetical protein
MWACLRATVSETTQFHYLIFCFLLCDNIPYTFLLFTYFMKYHIHVPVKFPCLYLTHFWTTGSKVIFIRFSLLRSRDSAVCIATRLEAGQPRGLCSRLSSSKSFFLFYIRARPALGPTQPIYNGCRGAVSLEAKQPRVTLITQLLLVPKLIMAELYLNSLKHLHDRVLN